MELPIPCRQKPRPFVAETLTEQYRGWVRDRDFCKAMIGFDGLQGATMATGNWGCGAFGGNTHIKFIQQLVAASLVGVSLVYCLVDSSPEKRQFRDDLMEIYKNIRRNKTTAWEVYRCPGFLRSYLIKRLSTERP